MGLIFKNKKVLEVNNNTIKVFGEDYNVKLIYKNIKIIEINIKSHNIEIYTPNKYRHIDNEKLLEIVTRRIYDMIAEVEVESIMEKTRIMLKGLAPEDYRIERLPLGKLATFSDSDRTIIINPDIVKFRKEILEYTVLHEFCHLKYKKHVKGFKDMIRAHMPEFQNYEFVNDCI